LIEVGYTKKRRKSHKPYKGGNIMSSDFFDQNTGESYEDVPMNENPDGAAILVNGSHRPLEVGASFLDSVKSVASQAGFGKFKVFLNGAEIKPSSAPAEVRPNDRVEIRPFDEAG
jgi:hypothetical protein